MDIEKIIETKERLNQKLSAALSTMEYHPNEISQIKSQIKENQAQCPHKSSKYNWAIVNNICPYCLKKLG